MDDADTFRTPGKRNREVMVLKCDNSQLMADLKEMMYCTVLPTDKKELDNLVDYGMKAGDLTTWCQALKPT